MMAVLKHHTRPAARQTAHLPPDGGSVCCAVRVARLEVADGQLCVARAVHAALVDVGRAHDGILHTAHAIEDSGCLVLPFVTVRSTVPAQLDA